MAAKKEDQYGINMKQFCAGHQQKIEQALAQGEVTHTLLERHLEQLHWLQHERLVHLIVTVMTVFVELFLLDLALLHPAVSFGAAIAMLCMAVLLGFYFAHYFFLENTTQHWYRLTQQMMEQLQDE